MDCSPPGSSVHGIFQARILEWVSIPFSRESSRPRDWTQVSHIAERFLTIWAIRGGYELSGVVIIWYVLRNEYFRPIHLKQHGTEPIFHAFSARCTWNADLILIPSCSISYEYTLPRSHIMFSFVNSCGERKRQTFSVLEKRFKYTLQ